MFSSVNIMCKINFLIVLGPIISTFAYEMSRIKTNCMLCDSILQLLYGKYAVHENIMIPISVLQ